MAGSPQSYSVHLCVAQKCLITTASNAWLPAYKMQEISADKALWVAAIYAATHTQLITLSSLCQCLLCASAGWGHWCESNADHNQLSWKQHHVLTVRVPILLHQQQAGQSKSNVGNKDTVGTTHDTTARYQLLNHGTEYHDHIVTQATHQCSAHSTNLVTQAHINAQHRPQS